MFERTSLRIGRAGFESAFSRPPIPPFHDKTATGEKAIPTAPPPHLEIPPGSLPYYKVGRVAGLAATVTTVVSIAVPFGMIGRINFIEQQVTNFSPGAVEDFVEFQLLKDEDGIPPFNLFNGVISRRDQPKRRLIVNTAGPGQVISLRARVLPTAEGGLDGATVNVWCSIVGWFEPQGQTA